MLTGARPWTVVIVLLAGATPLRADDPARLVRLLASSDFAEREQATRALEKLGARAAPALEAAARSGELEVRRRATHLLEKLRDQQIAAELLSPRQVRLVFDNTPASRALRTLQDRTGMELVLTGRVDDLDRRRITLDTGAVSVWEALRQIERAAGLTEVFVVPRTVKEAAAADAPHVQHVVGDFTGHRPFLLAPGRTAIASDTRHAVRFRLLPHSSARAAGDLFYLEIRPDPELAWHRLDGVRLDAASDSVRERLQQALTISLLDQPATERPRDLPDGKEGQPWHVVPLVVPRATGDQPLERIRGAVQAQIYGVHPLLTVEDLKKAQGEMFAGLNELQLHLETVHIGAEHVDVRLRLRNIEPLAELSPLPRIVRVRAGLLAVRSAADLALESVLVQDADGKSLSRVELRADPGENGSARGHLRFQIKAEQRGPFRLIVPARRLVAVEVPFQLQVKDQ